MLRAKHRGFSLHAATTASAEDARGRDALVRYALRPPIAQVASSVACRRMARRLRRLAETG